MGRALCIAATAPRTASVRPMPSCKSKDGTHLIMLPQPRPPPAPSPRIPAAAALLLKLPLLLPPIPLPLLLLGPRRLLASTAAAAAIAAAATTCLGRRRLVGTAAPAPAGRRAPEAAQPLQHGFRLTTQQPTRPLPMGPDAPAGPNGRGLWVVGRPPLPPEGSSLPLAPLPPLCCFSCRCCLVIATLPPDEQQAPHPRFQNARPPQP